MRLVAKVKAASAPHSKFFERYFFGVRRETPLSLSVPGALDLPSTFIFSQRVITPTTAHDRFLFSTIAPLPRTLLTLIRTASPNRRDELRAVHLRSTRI
jgi:hypothetical protein